MAYMRGTYYVYESVEGGIQIHVGIPLRPGDYAGVPYDTPEFIREYDEEASSGHVAIPRRVMEDLAAKFWLEMPEEQKQRYMTDPYFEPYRIRARRKEQENDD